MLKGIIISLALTFLWVAAQVTIFHIRRPRRVFLSMVYLFSMTLPLFPLVYLITPPDLFFLPRHCSRASEWLGLGTGFFAHILLFFAYVEFFYYVERSVTLRLLVEFRKSPGTALDEVRKIYGMERMVAERLEVMKENGFTNLKDGVWGLTTRGRLFARTFILARRFLNLGPGQ